MRQRCERQGPPPEHGWASWNNPTTERLVVSVGIYNRREDGYVAMHVVLFTSHKKSLRDRFWSWWPW